MSHRVQERIIDAGAIPVHAEAVEESRADGRAALERALHDGEDFELCVVVSESGFSTREQLDELERVGVDAVLIGETLMRAADVEEAARRLSGGAELDV